MAVSVDQFKKAFAEVRSADTLKDHYQQVESVLKTLNDVVQSADGTDPAIEDHTKELKDLVKRFAAATKRQHSSSPEVAQDLRKIHQDGLSQISAVTKLGSSMFGLPDIDDLPDLPSLPAVDGMEGVDPDPALLGTIADWKGRSLFQVLGVSHPNLLGSDWTFAFWIMNECGHWVDRSADLVKLNQDWRRRIDHTRKAVQEAEQYLGELERIKPAIAARVHNDRSKRDQDFDDDMRNYLNAADAADQAVTSIATAQKKLGPAVEALRGATLGLSIDKARNEYKILTATKAQLEADIEKTKGIFKEAMDIAFKVASMDWEGLAKKAVGYVGEKVIEAEYAEELTDLKGKLKNAEAKVESLKTAQLLSVIKERHGRVDSAVAEIIEAQGKLEAALRGLDLVRASARVELTESKATAPAAEFLDKRENALRLIADVDTSCARYLDQSQQAIKDANTLSRYCDKLWGGMEPWWYEGAEAARNNFHNLRDWPAYAEMQQEECVKARKWCDQEAMTPFTQGLKIIRQALTSKKN